MMQAGAGLSCAGRLGKEKPAKPSRRRARVARRLGEHRGLGGPPVEGIPFAGGFC